MTYPWILGMALTALMGAALGRMMPLDQTVLLPLLLAFVPYVLAIWHSRRWSWRQVRVMVVVWALAARVLMLVAPYVLSNDAYRYHWEGTVQRAGHNPLELAPSAPELQHLRDHNWQQTAHREVPSAYPPLLLFVFRLGASLSSEAQIFKWIFLAFDLATWWAIILWLRKRGVSETGSLIWAWNPLVILEFAGMGHEMSLAIFCFVIGLWAWEPRRRPWVAAVAWTAAACAQVFVLPLLAGVVLAQRVRRLTFWLVAGVTAVVLCAPFLTGIGKSGLGLLTFGARWEFNGSLFPLVRCVIGPETAIQLANGIWLSDPMARTIVAVMLLVVLMVCARRRLSAPRAAQWMLGGLLLLSPTVHPWYLTWMVALLAVEFRAGWLLLTATVLISYTAKICEIADGGWHDAVLIRWIEYLPVYLVLVWGVARTSLTAAKGTATLTTSGSDASRSPAS